MFNFATIGECSRNEEILLEVSAQVFAEIKEDLSRACFSH